MFRTNISISVVCRNVNCQHFIKTPDIRHGGPVLRANWGNSIHPTGPCSVHTFPLIKINIWDTKSRQTKDAVRCCRSLDLSCIGPGFTLQIHSLKQYRWGPNMATSLINQIKFVKQSCDFNRFNETISAGWIERAASKSGTSRTTTNTQTIKIKASAAKPVTVKYQQMIVKRQKN